MSGRRGAIMNFSAFRFPRRRSLYKRWSLLRERAANRGGGARFVYFPLLMGDLFVLFLASQDALEVMRVTESLTHLLTYSLSKRSH